MGIRTHYEISFMAAIVGLLLILVMVTGAEPLAAQTAVHAKLAAKAESKTADIVRDPADVPPPVANRLQSSPALDTI